MDERFEKVWSEWLKLMGDAQEVAVLDRAPLIDAGSSILRDWCNSKESLAAASKSLGASGRRAT